MDIAELLRGRIEFKFCIDDLKYALEHVGSDYVKWTMINMDDKTEILEQEKENDQKKTKETYCERVFAYELYHQFRKLMCDDIRYRELLFNGEQRKDESFFKDLFKELEDKDYVIPDLILHKTLGSIDKHEGQILYIEIKTINNSDVFSDLEKLTQLTRTPLNFYYYIFIYVNADFDDLKKKIKGDRKKNEYENIDDNILCFWVKEQKADYKLISEMKEIIKNDKS